MALKGKKKARRRGSQARRRPAAPPRPTYGGREKRRWYQTTSGLVLGFIVIAAVAIFVIWRVADSRSDAQALETSQNELQDYTSRIRATTQSLDEIVGEIASAGQLKDDELAEKIKPWKDELATAQTGLSQALPPADLETANGLITQSVLLYVQAVEQYELLADLEGNAREQLASEAARSVSTATTIFQSAVALIDDARDEAELGASGLTPPGSPAGGLPSGTEIEVPGSTP